MMAKLRGGSRVAELEQFVEQERSVGRLLPSAEAQYRQMLGRVELKKQALVTQASLGRQFYDSVLGRITEIISVYSNSENYSPASVRLFLGELFNAWTRNQEGLFIELASEAFSQAAGQLGEAAVKKEQLAGFNKFFFRHLG
jgi:hypothetical protein